MLRILLFLFLSASFVFAEEINDPFEELNRISFEFNETINGETLRVEYLSAWKGQMR